MTRGAQDPTLVAISDLIIVDLRTHVGFIEESNIRRDVLTAERGRFVVEQDG